MRSAAGLATIWYRIASAPHKSNLHPSMKAPSALELVSADLCILLRVNVSVASSMPAARPVPGGRRSWRFRRPAPEDNTNLARAHRIGLAVLVRGAGQA